jgi:hypothetical protein
MSVRSVESRVSIRGVALTLAMRVTMMDGRTVNFMVE